MSFNSYVRIVPNTNLRLLSLNYVPVFAEPVNKPDKQVTRVQNQRVLPQMDGPVVGWRISMSSGSGGHLVEIITSACPRTCSDEFHYSAQGLIYCWFYC